VGPETDWKNALKNVDAVIHLAARAHVLKDDAGDPLAEHRRVNTEGTRRLAKQAVECDVKRFIFVSSIGVLGNNSLAAKNGHSFTEEDQPQPHDDYSRSKWEAEQVLADFDDLETCIIRPPLIYGPEVPGNLRKLLDFARKGGRLPLGGVRNKRSLLGVRNLNAFVGHVLGDARAVNQTYVLADSEELSTAELFRTLSTHLGREAKLLTIPESTLRFLLRAAGKARMAERLCASLVIDSSKARTQLGWIQPVKMNDGLKEMAEWFRTLTT
jgi:nucleoside-diphosphate-sugar epimerase